MEFFFLFFEHFVGEDTDPIDLLPLVVLACLLWSVRHLRAHVLEVRKELSAVKEHIGLSKQIQELIDRNNPPSTPK